MTVKQIEGYSIYMNKILGKGSYGSVYVGCCEKTKQPVAVKILSKQFIDRDDYLKAALKNEIDILQKVNSQNIVAFYDVMQSSKNYYIIQQLCDGDMQSDIKPGSNIPEEVSIGMLRQICNGFLSLVKEGIIHRDLKPANIMKKGSILKLGDFGFAKQFNPAQSKNMMQTCVGTPLYMSLEILKGEQYTSKCDIWALGFIFYEILHGTTPWIANTEVQLVNNISKMPLNIKRTDLSNQTIDFLKRSLQKNEAQRISWDQIFVHPIFKGYFHNQSNSNQEYQNKLKTIMGKLRFDINQKNLNLKTLLLSVGFSENKKQVSLYEFFNFLRQAYPEISQAEAEYVFKKTDTDNSGSICVQEIETMLLENGMKLDTQFQNIPKFEEGGGGSQTFIKISNHTNQKIKSLFQKLYKIIRKNEMSLWKVFTDFDKKKGSLSIKDFQIFLKKLANNQVEFSQEEVKIAFCMIDEDSSGTIEFQELDKYYSKINGIPEEGSPHNQLYPSIGNQHHHNQMQPNQLQPNQINQMQPNHLQQNQYHQQYQNNYNPNQYQNNCDPNQYQNNCDPNQYYQNQQQQQPMYAQQGQYNPPQQYNGPPPQQYNSNYSQNYGACQDYNGNGCYNNGCQNQNYGGQQQQAPPQGQASGKFVPFNPFDLIGKKMQE